MKLVGQSLRRIEDPRLLSGSGKFLDDIPVSDVFFAEFVRSPYAHARILEIDFSELKAKEGFIACFTFKDFQEMVEPLYIPKEHEAPIPKIRPLADGNVRRRREPVAVIIATERYIAEDLASMVRVEYEPLQPN